MKILIITFVFPPSNDEQGVAARLIDERGAGLISNSP
jgi:hypothetical protein